LFSWILGGEPLDDPSLLLHLAKRQPARATGDRFVVESSPGWSLIEGMKFEQSLVTLCSRKAVSFFWYMFFSQKD